MLLLLAAVRERRLWIQPWRTQSLYSMIWGHSTEDLYSVFIRHDHVPWESCTHWSQYKRVHCTALWNSDLVEQHTVLQIEGGNCYLLTKWSPLPLGMWCTNNWSQPPNLLGLVLHGINVQSHLFTFGTRMFANTTDTSPVLYSAKWTCRQIKLL